MEEYYLNKRAKQLIDRLTFLAKFNFKFIGLDRIDPSPIRPDVDIVELTYLAEHSQRQIRFILGFDGSYYINMNIKNTDPQGDKKTHLGGSKYVPEFKLREWGIKNKIGDTGFETSIQSPDESFETFIERYSLTIEALCEKELNKILRGDIWENVPFVMENWIP